MSNRRSDRSPYDVPQGERYEGRITGLQGGSVKATPLNTK